MKPPENNIVEVPCNLNELYNGCYKNIEFTRNVLTSDGRTTTEVIETRYYGFLEYFSVVGAGLKYFEKIKNQLIRKNLECFF